MRFLTDIATDPRYWQPKIRLTLLTLATFAALC